MPSLHAPDNKTFNPALVNLPSLQAQVPTGTLNGSLPSCPLINAPLNLSVNAAAGLGLNGLLGGAPAQVLASPHPAAMPQFILASGQLIQGIQGAQLLIPTSQGIATQTILTIPVNHVTNNQIVNVALSNGQVVTTTLGNLQTMAPPHHLIAPPTVATSATHLHNGGPPISPPLSAPGLPSYPLLSNGTTASPLGSQPYGAPPPCLQQHLTMPQGASPTTTAQPQAPAIGHNGHHRSTSLMHSNHQQQQYSNCKSPPNVVTTTANPPHHHLGGTMCNGGSGSSNGASSPPSTASLSPLNRLAASNSDLTITTTTAAKTSSYLHSPPPPSRLLDMDDSPNQPTISQTSCNMVDGINLDEIKEFAKAFKLRRLSLGLTQTQVGQALSITEGPAYSQSAICRFEKLDITPKSAQKIKPVLERWMKEAEERYKSGQNHLTDFIGVEPSKKRKRRTSFTPQALELLNAHFERNTHPSGTEITTLAHQLGYEREVIRIWFCNKRQALKNTVRMMSKSSCPT